MYLQSPTLFSFPPTFAKTGVSVFVMSYLCLQQGILGSGILKKKKIFFYCLVANNWSKLLAGKK